VGTAGYLVAGTLQPTSYSPVRDTVSVLAGYAGADRWLMTSALFLVGGSTLGLAERVTTSVEAMWPFAVALTLRRTGPGRGSDRGHTDRLPDRLGWRTLGGRGGPRTLPHLAVGPDELVQPHRIRGLAPTLPGQAVTRHLTGLPSAAVGNEKQFRGHHRQVMARLMLVPPASQVHLGDRLQAMFPGGIDQHRELDAVSDGDGQRLD
jgi:hypothetical protein